MKLSELGASAAVVTLALALVVQTEAEAQAACTWTMTDLPVPQGVGVSGVSDASADGVWAVAWTWGRTSVVWKGGEAKVLKFREDTTLHGVSGSGAVAGNTRTQSVRLSAEGVREVLQPLEGVEGRTWVTSMNSAGDVAGTSGGAAVVWPAGSVAPRLLPDVLGRSGWTVRDIDDEGRVIAHRIIGGGNEVGAIWDRDGGQVLLEPLPGHGSVRPVSVRAGRVIGSSGVDSNVQGTVVEWGPDGKVVRSLPSLSDYPLGINARGDVASFADGQVVVVRSGGDTERVAPWGNDLRMGDDGSVIGMFADSNAGPAVPRRATCA